MLREVEETIAFLNNNHSLSHVISSANSSTLSNTYERRSIKKEVTPQEKEIISKENDIFVPKEKDSLFWCIFYMLSDEHQLEMAEKSPFATRAASLIEWTSIVRKAKSDLKALKIKSSEVETALLDNFMKPIVCAALCSVFNKPMVIINGNTYFKTGVSVDNASYNVVVRDKHRDNWVVKKNQHLSQITVITKHKLECVPGSKCLKAVGSYTKSDLEELSKTLGLPVINTSGKAMSKSEMYKAISDFVSL